MLSVTAKIDNIEQITVGMIVREKDSKEPFPDCVVVRIRHTSVDICRPYAIVSSANTVCPTVLLGQETFEIGFGKLQKHYVSIVTRDGKNYDFSR